MNRGESNQMEGCGLFFCAVSFTNFSCVPQLSSFRHVARYHSFAAINSMMLPSVSNPSSASTPFYYSDGHRGTATTSEHYAASVPYAYISPQRNHYYYEMPYTYIRRQNYPSSIWTASQSEAQPTYHPAYHDPRLQDPTTSGVIHRNLAGREDGNVPFHATSISHMSQREAMDADPLEIASVASGEVSVRPLTPLPFEDVPPLSEVHVTMVPSPRTPVPYATARSVAHTNGMDANYDQHPWLETMPYPYGRDDGLAYPYYPRPTYLMWRYNEACDERPPQESSEDPPCGGTGKTSELSGGLNEQLRRPRSSSRPATPRNENDDPQPLDSAPMPVVNTRARSCDESTQGSAETPRRASPQCEQFQDDELPQVTPPKQSNIHPPLTDYLSNSSSRPSRLKRKARPSEEPNDYDDVPIDFDLDDLEIHHGDQSVQQQQKAPRRYRRSKKEKQEEELSNQIIPNDRDVLCGKGGKTLEHNMHFTKLCMDCAIEYSETKKRGVRGKKGIALGIVRTVQEQNGRFLKALESGWEEISDDEAIKKVAHCIRDIMRNVRS